MTKNKKYELTDETIEFCGSTLHRIRALRGFGTIPKGELGGFVASEANLSHRGTCWVHDDACVSFSASVEDDAQIMDCARVSNRARISGDAIVSESAWITDDARVERYARVFGDARVSGVATIKDYASVYGEAMVEGYANIGGHSGIGGNTAVSGNAEVSIIDILEDLPMGAVIRGRARILHLKDMTVISPLGSRGDRLTAYRSEFGGIEVSTGCFQGTLEEFANQVKLSHGRNQYGKEYRAAIAFIKKFFSIDRGLD